MNTNEDTTQHTTSIQPASSGIGVPLTPEQAHQTVGALQLLGIHPACAVILVTVDAMLFGLTVATAGVSYIVVSIPASIVMGFVVTVFQKRSYNDDWLLAGAKGLTFALLTAIPTPLPSIITAGSGLLGGIQSVKNIINKPKPVQGTVVQTPEGREVIYVRENPKTNKALWIVIVLLMVLVAVLMIRLFI